MSISNRDLEALTAYLDGELSEKEKKNLEANLQSDEQLRKTLEDLRQTRTIIRSLPSLRAPRNFYITPAMVGEKEKPYRAFPVLRLASVVATLVLVLLFLGDIFVLPDQAMAPARSLQVAEAPVEQAEQMEYEAETVEGQLPEVPAEESMDRLEMELEPAAPEAEAMIGPSIEPTPGLEKLMATELPAPAEAMEDVVGGIAEAEDTPDLRIETRESFSQPEVKPQPQINLRMMIRIGEIALIFIALSTGLAAFFLYLKNR